MTWYLQIDPLQSPFDLGLDPQNRVQVAFNVRAVRVATAGSAFLAELVAILEDAGVGTFGTTIFASSGASLPTTGTILTLRETAGPAPQYTQNKLSPTYVRPSAQIVAHGVDYPAAAAMASAAWAALSVIKNMDVSP